MGVSTRDLHNSCYNRKQTFYFENSYCEGMYMKYASGNSIVM